MGVSSQIGWRLQERANIVEHGLNGAKHSNPWSTFSSRMPDEDRPKYKQVDSFEGVNHISHSPSGVQIYAEYAGKTEAPSHCSNNGYHFLNSTNLQGCPAGANAEADEKRANTVKICLNMIT